MNLIYVKNGYDEQRRRYNYQSKIYVGGKDGSAYYFSTPTLHLLNKESSQLTPNKSRLNNLTYSCVLSADILVETAIEGQDEIHREVLEGELDSHFPIMIMSKLCIPEGHASRIIISR